VQNLGFPHSASGVNPHRPPHPARRDLWSRAIGIAGQRLAGQARGARWSCSFGPRSDYAAQIPRRSASWGTGAWMRPAARCAADGPRATGHERHDQRGGEPRRQSPLVGGYNGTIDALPPAVGRSCAVANLRSARLTEQLPRGSDLEFWARPRSRRQRVDRRRPCYPQAPMRSSAMATGTGLLEHLRTKSGWPALPYTQPAECTTFGRSPRQPGVGWEPVRPTERCCSSTTGRSGTFGVSADRRIGLRRPRPVHDAQTSAGGIDEVAVYKQRASRASRILAPHYQAAAGPAAHGRTRGDPDRGRSAHQQRAGPGQRERPGWVRTTPLTPV
jgi:hypothetical protein